MNHFSEDKYFSKYKQIRNYFRHYTPESILTACIEHINSPTENKTKQLEKHPWLIFLLIKWVYLDEESKYAGKDAINTNQINRINQLLNELRSLARMPSQYDNITLFFRNMAFQQFLYQLDFNYGDLARQKILFDNIEDNHYFKTRFHKLTGINISDFLILSIGLVARFTEQRGARFNVDWFFPFKNRYSAAEVTKYLDILSVPSIGLSEFFKENDQGKRQSTEYYEQTPFLRAPLIQTDSQYICVYPNLLFRAVEHFIYDYLRRDNSSVFMDKFGSAFETYIDNSLRYSGVKYYTEKEIQRLIPSIGKNIDFVVSDNRANVFIDAKAVEMSYQGKVAHRSEILKDRTKTSIIKAIEQAYSVAGKLKESGVSHDKLRWRDNNYVVVVTYKELYLGNGSTFFECIGKDSLSKIRRQHPNVNIPVENIYFLTISNLDTLLEAVKDGVTTLVETLERAKISDANPKTRKFDFILHLREWGFDKLPNYLEEEYGSLVNSIKKDIELVDLVN